MARRALVLLVVVAGLIPLPAPAADAARPLRTLAFDCSINVIDRRETPADTRSSHVVMMGREPAMIESATFESSSRRELGATLSVVRSSITLTLTADSFSKLRPT
ncbi:MAG TPA: hypothetical protein VHT05_09275 [Candidatus Elarobacter sp.]|jgi:hypothetical protein|nr:hypothetical protein [Candidatus Elarobacter sp.]